MIISHKGITYLVATFAECRLFCELIGRDGARAADLFAVRL